MFKKYDIAEVRASNRSSMLFLCHPDVPNHERYHALKELMVHCLDQMKIDHMKLDAKKEEYEKKE